MKDAFATLPGHQHYGPPAGSPASAPVRKADLLSESVAGGEGYNQGTIPQLLPAVVDDIARDFGPNTYEAMATDPAVHSAVETVVLGILAGGMDLMSPMKPKPGAKDLTPDEKLGKELVDFCWRCIERVPNYKGTFKQLLYAMRTGSKVAEKVYELAADGPDKGKLVPKAIKVKPRDSCEFVEDRAGSMNIVQVQCRTFGGETVRIPREKFLVLSWDPRDDDPRGTSILRRAYTAWNLKVRMYPQYYKYARQFASASLVGFLAENPVPVAQLDEKGIPIEGKPKIAAAWDMASTLANFQNGSVAVFPFGAQVLPVQPQGDGKPFTTLFDLCNREITQAILLQVRATVEAQFGSRADSQTGQDILGLLIAYGREVLGEVLRNDLFKHLVALNYGDDVAARLTPLVTFGQSEPQDQPTKWSAAASLGYQVAPSQVEELSAMLGLPIPDLEADEAKADAKAQKALEQAQAMKPDPATANGGPPKPGADAPAKEPKPAEFAAMTDAWDASDVAAAWSMIGTALGSSRKLKAFRRGRMTRDERLAAIKALCASTRARMSSEAEALLLDLRLDPAVPAEFASPFGVVSRWVDASRQFLRRSFLAGTLLLLGPGELDDAARLALREASEEQAEYLDGFATALIDRTQPLGARVASRAGQYGDAVWIVSQAVGRARALADGMTTSRSVLGASEESCSGPPKEDGLPSCVDEQAKGWQPIGTVSLPGKRKCKVACKCHMEYRK